MGGKVSFDTPMIFSLGFLMTFLFGGLTGIILAAPTLDFAAVRQLLRRRPTSVPWNEAPHHLRWNF